MRTSRVTKTLGAIGVVLLLAFLLYRAQSVSSTQHDRYNADLLRLKESDALLDDAVLRTRYRLLVSYDPVNAGLAETRRLQSSVKTPPGYIGQQGQAEMRREFEAFSKELDHEDSGIQQFKSQNAVINNSLRYFPIAARNLVHMIEADPGARNLVADLNLLVADVLGYSFFPDEPLGYRIKAQVEYLTQTAKTQDPTTKAQLLIILNHANTILEKKPALDNLTKELISGSAVEHADKLYNSYTQHYGAALESSNFYRLCLYGVSVSLLCLIILQLRSATRGLHGAKQRLEQEIHERTQANEALQAEVSERQRAEEELRLQKSLLESQSEASLDGVLVISAAGKIISLNQHFIEIWGIADEVLATKSGATALQTIADKLNHPGEFLNLADYSRQHTDEKSDQEITLIDGRILHCYSTPVMSSDSIYYGRASYFRDITERKQLENTLRQERIFLRTLIDNIPDSIYVKDMACRKVIANLAEIRIAGAQSEADVLGKDDFALHPKELAEKFFADDQMVLQTGQSLVNKEEYVVNEQGEITLLLTTKIALHDEKGKIIGLIGLGRDITERKELENQLLQAQKLESVGQLAAGISHEINTPTQYVSDNTRFLRDSFQDLLKVHEKYSQLAEACRNGAATTDLLAEVDASAKEADVEYLTQEIPKAIEQSLEGTERISKIVQSMKDFAHPGIAVKQACDLNKAIDSTITVASSEWKYVAEMVTDFDTTLPLVPCLQGQFNQVVLNMIINATHAIGDVIGDGSAGKGTITISTRRTGAWAEIRVCDTGTGIPEANRARIFDPFFTTKQVGKGTGQGLAISYTVVEKHGGTITFETAEGEGTTFIIRLPLQEIAKMPDGLKEAA